MVDNHFSKKRIKHHFAYAAWKYVLLAVVCVVSWDLVYNMTRYQAPPEKRVHIYILQAGADVEALETDWKERIAEAFPDMEEMQFFQIGVTKQEDYTVVMQLAAYMAAQQGDVFFTPSYKYTDYAGGENGVFMPLEELIEQGAIDVTGLDLESAKARSEEGEEHIYGIPADGLYGLLQYGIDPADTFLSIPYYSGNPENAAKMIDFLIREFSTEKPEGYDEYRAQKETESQSQTQAGMIF